MYKLIFHKRVVKFINKQNSKNKAIIKEKLLLLQNNPYPSHQELDNKKMTNQIFYRLRIGKMRFLYCIEENDLIIYLDKADTRGDIYK